MCESDLGAPSTGHAMTQRRSPVRAPGLHAPAAGRDLLTCPRQNQDGGAHVDLNGS